jgi:hypothetical protein
MTFHGFILTFTFDLRLLPPPFPRASKLRLSTGKVISSSNGGYGSLFILCTLVDGRSRALLFSPPSPAPVVKFWAIRPQLFFGLSSPDT